MRVPTRTARLFVSATFLALAAAGLSGCKTALDDITGSSGLLSSASLASQPAKIKGKDDRQELATAGERYQSNPRDANAALRYAEGLRKSGQRAQAAAVLQQASIAHPTDKRLIGAYGRALAETGNFEQSIELLNRAHSPDRPDWRILSAQGAVLDQIGRNEEARRYYETALKIVPDEPSVLSNLGLSYALTHEPAKAEEVLRKAYAGRQSDKRVRQNLALVVGLQGRFQEAEEIVRGDLPADEAAQNIAYLKELLEQNAAPRVATPRTPAQTTASPRGAPAKVAAAPL